MILPTLLYLTLLVQAVISVPIGTVPETSHSYQANALDFINCLYLHGFPEDTSIAISPQNDLYIHYPGARTRSKEGNDFYLCSIKHGDGLELTLDPGYRTPHEYYTVIGSLIEVLNGEIELPNFSQHGEMNHDYFFTTNHKEL